MTNYEPLAYVIGYAVIASIAMFLLDGSNRRALRLIRYTYEMGIGLLSQRVDELERENSRLRRELDKQVAASDLSAYEDLEV